MTTPTETTPTPREQPAWFKPGTIITFAVASVFLAIAIAIVFSIVHSTFWGGDTSPPPASVEAPESSGENTTTPETEGESGGASTGTEPAQDTPVDNVADIPAAAADATNLWLIVVAVVISIAAITLGDFLYRKRELKVAGGAMIGVGGIIGLVSLITLVAASGIFPDLSQAVPDWVMDAPLMSLYALSFLLIASGFGYWAFIKEGAAVWTKRFAIVTTVLVFVLGAYAALDQAYPDTVRLVNDSLGEPLQRLFHGLMARISLAGADPDGVLPLATISDTQLVAGAVLVISAIMLLFTRLRKVAALVAFLAALAVFLPETVEVADMNIPTLALLGLGGLFALPFLGRATAPATGGQNSSAVAPSTPSAPAVADRGNTGSLSGLWLALLVIGLFGCWMFYQSNPQFRRVVQSVTPITSDQLNLDRVELREVDSDDFYYNPSNPDFITTVPNQNVAELNAATLTGNQVFKVLSDPEDEMCVYFETPIPGWVAIWWRVKGSSDSPTLLEHHNLPFFVHTLDKPVEYYAGRASGWTVGNPPVVITKVKSGSFYKGYKCP